MDVTVINENNVEVSIDPPETIVVEVDQGKAGRGIASVTYQPDGTVYYLEITYTDGTTELVGPIPVDEPATITQYYIKASAAITKGDLVMFTGAVGASGVLQGAPAAAGLAEGLVVMGIAAETMATNGFGYVTAFGLVQGINTTGSAVGETWATGDILYYNPAYVGKLTKVRPTSPAEVVVVAAVTNANAGNGSLFVRVSFYPKLTELSDVYAVSPANNDLLQWSTANNRWQKTTNLVTGGTISETVGGTVYPVASQYDIGTDPNQIPLNQYLGNLAYQDAGSIAGNVVIGGTVTSAGITSTGPSVISVNSTSDALRITQTGTGNALVVEDSANPDSSPFVVDASGNVVLGNTTATTIYGFSPQLQVLSAGNGYQLNSSYRADAFSNILTIAHSRNATIGSHTVLQSGDETGAVAFAGSDGTAFIRAAQITAVVDGTPGTNDMPGRLVFSTTADGASSPTERMRIDSAGSVGIGTTSFSGYSLLVSKSLTGTVSPTGIGSQGQVQSDATSSATYFRTSATTAASAFTLTSLRHYYANQSTIGAGSTVTNQFGFLAESTLTGATNNYGFYSNIASGTGRWNFYAGGTAANYFAGQTQVACSLPTGSNANLTVGNRLDISDTSNNTDVITLDWSANTARLRITQWSGTYRDLEIHAGGAQRLRIATDGNVTFKNAITETVATLGTSGTIALNPANGTIQTCAASATVTFTDSLSAGQSVTLMLTGGSTYTINWPTATWVTASGNAAPTLTAADTVVFWKVSTTLYAAYVGSYV